MSFGTKQRKFFRRVSHKRMTGLIIVALMLFSLVPLSLAADSDLQDDIGEVLAQEGLTGAAWMLIGEDGKASLGAAGFSDNKSKVRFTTDTRFHVGSVTKNLLSIGVLRLVTMGKIGLDIPIVRYLPNLQFDNPWSGTNDVTVRHLLDHTSGLDDSRMWQMFSERPEVFIGHGWFEPPGLCAKLKLIEKLYTEMRSIYVHSNYISISPFSSAQLCFIAGKH